MNGKHMTVQYYFLYGNENTIFSCKVSIATYIEILNNKIPHSKASHNMTSKASSCRVSLMKAANC